MMAVAGRNPFNSSKHYALSYIFDSTITCIIKAPGHRSKVACVKVACLNEFCKFGPYNFLRVLHSFGDRAKVMG